MGAQVNATPTRPLSFVVVAFSNELAHNILRSVCVNDPFNQLVLIDNTANLYYNNLSQAINAGLDRAHHELIVVVHEDVYLPPDWQICFESSLKAIEQRDPDWGVLGTNGWTETAVRPVTGATHLVTGIRLPTNSLSKSRGSTNRSWCSADPMSFGQTHTFRVFTT